MPDDALNKVAIAIFWAAFEMYPLDERNPVSRMTKEQAWEKTSDQHRALCKFQAHQAMASAGLITTVALTVKI